jgi:hypothetical protein
MGIYGEGNAHQPTTISRQLERRGSEGGVQRAVGTGRQEGDDLGGERGESGAIAAAAAQQAGKEAAEGGA